MKKLNDFFKKALVSLFILHFFLIGLFLLPDGPLKTLTSPLVNLYVDPLFRQNWHMFAPEPLTFSSRLIIKCKSSNEWLDPTSELLRKNAELPLIHFQKSIFLFNSIGQTILDMRTDFIEETRCQEKSLKYCESTYKEWIQKSDAYSKAREVGKLVCKGEDSSKLGIYIEHAKAFSLKYKIPNQGIEILELD